MPNVAAGMVLTSIDQLWVADITYIHLQWEFVYLAVVLDVVLGWFDGGYDSPYLWP
jgi:putative transposase